ncbi:MAG: hypothetical protein QXH46_01460 [Sulfolobales archaeon]
MLFISSLPAIYLSTAFFFPCPTCGSVSPAVSSWFTRLPSAKQSALGVPLAMLIKFIPTNIIIYVKIYKHEHRFVTEKYGLDKHTAPAYLIALKYLRGEKTVNSRKARKQHN